VTRNNQIDPSFRGHILGSPQFEITGFLTPEACSQQIAILVYYFNSDPLFLAPLHSEIVVTNQFAVRVVVIRGEAGNEHQAAVDKGLSGVKSEG
jgi:hypothetical protein